MADTARAATHTVTAAPRPAHRMPGLRAARIDFLLFFSLFLLSGPGRAGPELSDPLGRIELVIE